MLRVLANRTYRHLFLAQVIALIGTGLATVALGLLAYDIAGGDAGAVLGTALAIKMIAYIGVAPIAGAFADRVPRKALLVALDLVRAGVALFLPFVTEIWQVYVLIFVLQSASAAFTPTFQATIPDVLPDEADYTRALSLSRLAYDMESLTSPILAAALLTLINFHWLFSGTAIGFLASAALVVTSGLPRAMAKPREGGIYEKTTRGIRIYLKTPRMRGLLAVTLAAAAASAMVIVNTVVIVRGLGLGQREVALTLAAFGGGSMLAAFTLPRILDRIPDRLVMVCASADRPRLLAPGARRLGRARHRLFDERDTRRQAAAPLGQRRRSPGAVRRTVRAEPCLLADRLSVGGSARREGRHDRRLWRHRAARGDRRRGGAVALAKARSRCRATPACGPARRASASERGSWRGRWA